MPDNAFYYTAFVIEDDQRTVSFHYEIGHDDEQFALTERMKFPVSLSASPAILAGLRALHLALGVSYYKIFADPLLQHPYAMDQAEADFLNSVWRGGLGEYLYVNQLAPDRLARFEAQAGREFVTAHAGTDETQALLGIGGGKDSIVAGELLKACNVDVAGFVMATGEQLGQAQAVADTMGVALHVVERSLDTQLLSLQERPDAYKGHVPVSLIFGLVGTVLAAALGRGLVVVANEASASIPRVEGEYGAVNHQWSKSFGFETQLQTYIHSTIAADMKYCSAIRQLTSVAVAKIFANFSRYFEVFTSDNYVFRIDPAKRPNARWSLESPKSLSSFLLLGPWLSESDLLRTFGRNFLDEPSLEPLFKALTGLAGEPPLDCVGTVDELVLSINLMATQRKFYDNPLMKLAHRSGLITGTDWTAALADMLGLQPEQALPAPLVTKITDRLGGWLQ